MLFSAYSDVGVHSQTSLNFARSDFFVIPTKRIGKQIAIKIDQSSVYYIYICIYYSIYIIYHYNIYNRSIDYNVRPPSYKLL